MPLSLDSYIASIQPDLLRAVHGIRRKPHIYPTRPLVEGYSSDEPTATVVYDVESPHVKKHKIHRSTVEWTLLEASTNSIRCSVVFKQEREETTSDSLDQAIWNKYVGFFQRRYQNYGILRKRPVEGYSISFLITDEHVEMFGVHEMVQVILDFIAHVEKECSDVKISLNTRARVVATEFLSSF